MGMIYQGGNALSCMPIDLPSSTFSPFSSASTFTLCSELNSTELVLKASSEVNIFGSLSMSSKKENQIYLEFNGIYFSECNHFPLNTGGTEHSGPHFLMSI